MGRRGDPQGSKKPGGENLEQKVRSDRKLWGSVWRHIQEKAG